MLSRPKRPTWSVDADAFRSQSAISTGLSPAALPPNAGDRSAGDSQDDGIIWVYRYKQH